MTFLDWETLLWKEKKLNFYISIIVKFYFKIYITKMFTRFITYTSVFFELSSGKFTQWIIELSGESSLEVDLLSNIKTLQDNLNNHYIYTKIIITFLAQLMKINYWKEHTPNKFCRK